jgi:outer membrane protein assembly factor BamB
MDGLCRATVSVWPTLGGDIHHSGQNPIETGMPPLTPAWSSALGVQALSPAVSDGSSVYVNAQTEIGGSAGSSVSAISPTDGSVVWSHALGWLLFIAQVTVDDNHLYVAQADILPGGGNYMNSLLAANGDVAWSQPFDSQGGHYWAPLVVGGHVYFNGGEYGGVYSLEQGTGAQDWFANVESMDDEWSPLFLNDRVYTFTDSSLREFDPTSGALLASVTVPGGSANSAYDTMKTSPVSDGTNIFMVSEPYILAFSPALSTPRWSVAANYNGQPAIADGVLYALSFDGTLSALDAASGSVLWAFPGDGALSYPPVIAGHYVYVASDANVYAVDTATHQQVWTGAPGGWLSIANAQLYVARADGTLDAWQMTR